MFMFSPYPKEARQTCLAADLPHLLSVDKIMHKYSGPRQDNRTTRISWQRALERLLFDGHLIVSLQKS